MSELKITKEKVLVAAKGCPDAKKVLETLFPEVFNNTPEPINIPESPDRRWRKIFRPEHPLYEALEIRACGQYAGKGLFVYPAYRIEVVKDDENHTVILLYPKN